MIICSNPLRCIAFGQGVAPSCCFLLAGKRENPLFGVALVQVLVEPVVLARGQRKPEGNPLSPLKEMFA